MNSDVNCILNFDFNFFSIKILKILFKEININKIIKLITKEIKKIKIIINFQYSDINFLS